MKNDAEELDSTSNFKTLVSQLSERLLTVLQGVLPAGSKCALLDVHICPNVGDNAIWLGERHILRSIGANLVYAADRASYSRRELSARLEDGIILIQGGGNFGDLWLSSELFREKVISEFPDHRIIQLPQSICFRYKEHLNRARAIFNAHPRFMILVRDTRSLWLAQKEFAAPSLLCPDMAFGLGVLDHTSRPSMDVLCLRRTDIESAYPLTNGSDEWRLEALAAPKKIRFRLVDLIRPNRFNISTMIAHLAKTIIPTVARFRLPMALRLQLYDLHSRARLRYGLDMLGAGKIVITDRLHGHILSTLAGIPHVIISDRYGKVQQFYSTWMTANDLVRSANGPKQAFAEADALARRAPPETASD